MTRQDGRAYDELRPIKITTDFVKFAGGKLPHRVRRHQGALLRQR